MQRCIPLLLSPEQEEKLKNKEHEEIEKPQAKFYSITYDLKQGTPEELIKLWETEPVRQ